MHPICILQYDRDPKYLSEGADNNLPVMNKVRDDIRTFISFSRIGL